MEGAGMASSCRLAPPRQGGMPFDEMGDAGPVAAGQVSPIPFQQVRDGPMAMPRFKERPGVIAEEVLHRQDRHAGFPLALHADIGSAKALCKAR